MENKLTKLFNEKKNNILSIFFTAGYPNLNDTTKIILALQNSGADMLEVGIPFSDPIADGPVIQESSRVALKNGISLKIIFQQLKSINEKIKIPIILMGYLNPIIQFGLDDFFKECKKIGIDGLIIPDLPFSEYDSDFKDKMRENNLSSVFLISPNTSSERISNIINHTTGFVYAVSGNSITGGSLEIKENQLNYFKYLAKLKEKTKVLIGFGIDSSSTLKKAFQYANGAIIGTAFINSISKKSIREQEIKSFINKIIPNERGIK